MITRDSKLWWLLIASAVVTAISSRMDLIDPLFPVAHTDKAHAVIELLALLAGVVGGVMRMSPLPITPEGRIDAVRKDTVTLSKARGAAAVASAVATADAVEAQSKLGK